MQPCVTASKCSVTCILHINNCSTVIVYFYFSTFILQILVQISFCLSSIKKKLITLIWAFTCTMILSIELLYVLDYMLVTYFLLFLIFCLIYLGRIKLSAMLQIKPGHKINAFWFKSADIIEGGQCWRAARHPAGTNCCIRARHPWPESGKQHGLLQQWNSQRSQRGKW